MATPALQDNTPAAGSISWPEFHIQYEGEGYTVPAGSTAERWTWWRFNAGAPALEYGPEVPQDLTEDDLVLFGNKNGVGVRVQSATLIDGELLVDGTVMANKLDAKAVTTEHLMADDALINGLLQAKATISEAVETEGLTIAGDQTWNKTTGFTIPEVVNFPPNNLADAYVWAKLIARSLTIENFFKLRGRNNEYSAGAKVVMADAITNPDGPPSQEAAWEQVTQLSVPEGAGNLRGIVREDAATNTWVALLINLGTSGNDCQLVRFVNGVETKRSPIMTATDGYGGICRSSSGYYYVCSNPSWYDNVSQGGVNAESFWTIEVVTPDLNTKWGTYQPNSRQVGFSDPGIRFTSDDTQIYAYSSSKIMIAGRVAGSIDRLHGLTWDASNPVGRADSVSITLSDRIPPNESFQGLTKGKPPGNDQLTAAPVSAGYWTAWYSSVDPFLNGANIPAVQRAYGKSLRGAWHDGTYHYTLDSSGKVYRYEKAKLDGQVGYIWRDTTDPKHETAVSPSATISVPRGAGVLVTPDAPPFTGDPDSPDTSIVFARVASGDPWRNHGAGTPTKFIGVIDGSAAIYGSEGISSFATAGITPFEWVSQKLDALGAPLIKVLGNGSWRLGDLQSEGNDGRFEITKKHTLVPTSGGTYTRNTELVRVGQLVFAFGDVDRPGGGFNASFHAIGGYSVPVGFRPSSNVLTGYVPNSAATATHRLRYNTDGTVEIQQSAAITSFMVTNAMWVTEDA